MTNRVEASVARNRLAFQNGRTTDGKPYPSAARRAAEKALDRLTPSLVPEYVTGADWGLQRGALTPEEHASVIAALDAESTTGWAASVDFPTKVAVTKVVNELLQERGDA